MDKLDRDRVEGTIDQATGRAKSAWGGATGDEQTEAEGKVDEGKGSLKETFADVKDKVTGSDDDEQNRP